LAWHCKACDNETRKTRRHGENAARTGLNFFKYCPICDLWKPRTEFHKNGRGGYCKACLVPKKAAEYQRDREQILARESARRHSLRLEMIAAYGDRCACCGEARQEFLSIEHVNGGGKAHQRRTGNVLFDLKKRGWPKDGFTLLCFNCNCGKGRLGVCPHERPMAEPDYGDPRKTAGPTKRCPRCGEEKPRATAFHHLRSGKAAPYCKACGLKGRMARYHARRRGEVLPDGPPTLGVLRHCPGCELWKEAARQFHRHAGWGQRGYQSLCKTCSKAGRLRRRAADTAASRRRSRRVVAEVQAAYGGVCQCCGEPNPGFLTLDHIHGGGTRERKRPGTKGSFYERVKRAGFPKNLYRLLCYNCNMSRGCFGYCPHETRQQPAQTHSRDAKESGGRQPSMS
jgi:hypothetical protein